MKQPDTASGEVLQQLQRREPIFHRPEFGTTRPEFAAMTAADFWEVGASGSVCSRDYVLDVLERRHADPTWREAPFETADFCCRQLAEDVFLVTYVLTQEQRRTRRATVWQRSDRVWIALYHQGTVIAAAAP